jgi:hypothetical protein
MARCIDCGIDYADLFEGRCKWCHREYQRKIEAAERRRQEAEDRRQREFLREMERQQRAAEERMVEMEKERERRADPQRWYGSEWVEHLKLHPEDAAKCRWASLKGDDVCNLLMHDPSYDVKCNLDLLSDESWGKLFAAKEVLVDKYLPKFDQKKIVKILCNLSRLKGPPQWVKRVALDKLSPIDKGKVLVHNNMCWYPFIGERFGSLKDLPVDDKAVLMTYSEKYHTLPGFDDWSIYSGHQQALIVLRYSECADRLDFSKVSAEDLTELLKKYPDMFSYRESNKKAFDQLSETQDVEILKLHPELIPNAQFRNWLRYSDKLIEELLRKFKGRFTPKQWAGLLYHGDYSFATDTSRARVRGLLKTEFSLEGWIDFLIAYKGGRSEDFINCFDHYEVSQTVSVEKAISAALNNSAYNAWDRLLHSFSPGKVLQFDWGRLTDQQRVEAAMGIRSIYCWTDSREKQMEVCAKILDYGVNVYNLSKSTLVSYWHIWPERFDGFDPDKYEWSEFGILKEAVLEAAKKASRGRVSAKIKIAADRWKMPQVGAFLKKHWMPILAVLLILGAFNGGGFWSFLIGAGLGIYWWKNRD